MEGLNDLLAVYGTLKRGGVGHERAGIVGEMEFVSECRIRGVVHDLGEYTGLVEGDGIIPGELFRVRDDETWRKLDEYEGVYYVDEPQESLFIRKIVRLVAPDIDAWVYFYNRPLVR